MYTLPPHLGIPPTSILSSLLPLFVDPVPAALCNAVLGNVLGVFVTPALLLWFLGARIELPLLSMLGKLSTKVVLPVLVGQVLRLVAPRLRDACERHSKVLKRLQEVVLLSILWNALCTATSQNLGLGLRHGLALAALLPVVHLLALTSLLVAFSHPSWRWSRPQSVAAAFCASHKTLAFGLPLVRTVFAGTPHVAWYSAPLVFVHPIQLVVGSLLVPRLQAYVRGEDGAQTEDSSKPARL